VNSNPAVAGGVVYFGSRNSVQANTLYALYANNGQAPPGWPIVSAANYPLDQVLAPAVSNGAVYAGGAMYPGSLSQFLQGVEAFDASNQAVLWFAQLCTPADCNPLGAGPPAVADGSLFIGTTSGPFVLSSWNGTSTSFLPDLESTGVCTSAPAVANGEMYIGCFDSNLRMFDTASQQLAWQYTTGAAVESSPLS